MSRFRNWAPESILVFWWEGGQASDAIPSAAHFPSSPRVTAVCDTTTLQSAHHFGSRAKRSERPAILVARHDCSTSLVTNRGRSPPPRGSLPHTLQHVLPQASIHHTDESLQTPKSPCGTASAKGSGRLAAAWVGRCALEPSFLIIDLHRPRPAFLRRFCTTVNQ
jgi:hypothetical protein